MFLSKKTQLWVAAASAWIALLACTPKQGAQDDPKNRLNEYIARSFSVQGPEDRAHLSAYLVGDAKARLESWSDDQFRQAFVETKRQFVKLAFKELKAVSADEVSVTYELTYQNTYNGPAGDKRDAKITNRKLAQMVRKDGQWFISDVRNIKELVEYKNEMSLP